MEEKNRSTTKKPDFVMDLILLFSQPFCLFALFKEKFYTHFSPKPHNYGILPAH